MSFSVPTGNFGNVYAGHVARRIGLPIARLVIGTNRNDILARYIADGDMTISGVEPSLSPSMDIQVSSNFERLLFELKGRNGAAIAEAMRLFRSGGSLPADAQAWRAARGLFSAHKVDDTLTMQTIADTYARSGTLIDPHTAVALAAARAELELRPDAAPMVALATAHPAKFPDAVQRATGIRPPPPPALAELFDKRERMTVLANDRDAGKTIHSRPCTARGSSNMTVRVSTLANGLHIATDRIDTVDTVSLGIWVDVGTRHEPAAINGVAHFLEHMAFKGTERRSALAIAEEIEAVGGHLNAYTSRESTAFYAKVLKEDVPLALDILADILQHSTFEAEEMERERTVILQEIGQANDTPDDIIFDHFQECAFPDQAMGRPVLGRPEIIRRLGREDVTAYLRDHYGARRMVLAAAGNLDHDRFVGAGGKAAGRDARPTARPPTEPARYAGGDRREERDLEQLHLVLGFPGLTLADPDFYAASVLSTAFGGGMSSRLFQEIREKRGLVYTIHCFAHSYRDGGLFGIYAGTGEDEAAELVPALCAEARKLEDGLSATELARAKTQMKAGLLDVARKHLGALRAIGAASADPRHPVRSARDRAPDRDGRRCRDRSRRRALALGRADPDRARAAQPARRFRPRAGAARRLMPC